MNPINLSLLRLLKRAENYDVEHLIHSFVSIDALSVQLSLPENQILFGRRGTGKTHIFSFLKNQLNQKDTTVSIDMRRIGSSGGIYADNARLTSERATRLLVDTLQAIHSSIYEQAVDHAEEWDFSRIAPCLDSFLDSTTDVVVVGTIQQTSSFTQNLKNNASDRLSLGTSPTPALNIELGNTKENGISNSISSTSTGSAQLKINFGRVAQEFENLVSVLPNQKIWIFLDEWSEIPLDLQPYLADLLKRTLFPIQGVVFKIAAIEQRSKFRLISNSENIGIETGADASTCLNLDEYLIFENNKDSAKSFFQNLIFKHLNALPVEQLNFDLPKDAVTLSNKIFTRSEALEEFVRASEGVPRDAINILAIAAQKACNDKISVINIRDAARKWYTQSKQQAISSNPDAPKLLNWIIEEVIKHRKSRGFLLDGSIRNELIDFLYDERVLHIIKQNISSYDAPGKRFNVYNIDYGCYVELINTANTPLEIYEQFEIFENSFSDYQNKPEDYIVPHTDYRSIRGAILDLDIFLKAKLK